MKLELAFLAIVVFLIYNTLHDGIYIKNIFKYKKHFQIAVICIIGFSLYLLFKRDPLRLKKILLSSTNMIKYMPIDKNSMDLISPIIDFSNSDKSFMNDLNESLHENYSHANVLNGLSNINNNTNNNNNNNNNNTGNANNKSTKRSVSETKKKYVAASQDWICKRCNNKLNAYFEVDHVIRLQNGGSNEVANLVALCPGCHREKSALETM